MSLNCCLLAELTTTYLYSTIVILSLVLPNFETSIYLILLGSWTLVIVQYSLTGSISVLGSEGIDTNMVHETGTMSLNWDKPFLMCPCGIGASIPFCLETSEILFLKHCTVLRIWLYKLDKTRNWVIMLSVSYHQQNPSGQDVWHCSSFARFLISGFLNL